MKRLIRLAVPAGLALALFLQGSAGAATAEISIGDNFFSPANTKVKIGDSAHWTWTGSNPHSTTSDGSMPYVWDSGIKSSGDFTKAYTVAGKFSYHCNIHGSMHGSVAVAPKVGPATAPAGQRFTIRFASAAIDGMGFTAVVQKQDPGGSFANFKSATTGTFVKWDSTGAAPGVYKFRVILKSGALTSLASTAKGVTVT
jgi:plastocyanin